MRNTSAPSPYPYAGLLREIFPATTVPKMLLLRIVEGSSMGVKIKANKQSVTSAFILCDSTSQQWTATLVGPIGSLVVFCSRN